MNSLAALTRSDIELPQSDVRLLDPFDGFEEVISELICAIDDALACMEERRWIG
jgi:hypothetical protein